jgi:hypothetical protein
MLASDLFDGARVPDEIPNINNQFSAHPHDVTSRRQPTGPGYLR